MGFISFTCAKCQESIPNYLSTRASDSEAVLVTPHATYRSCYNGYGVFEGQDVFDLLGEGDREKGVNRFYVEESQQCSELPFKLKVLHARCFSNEKYEDLPSSGDCKYQSFFYPEDDSEKVA